MAFLEDVLDTIQVDRPALGETAPEAAPVSLTC
jgi:hypothetical protein